jgi:phage terminase large subunit GpA-like protein
MQITNEQFWTAPERAAWAPPEDITVSQWAAKHRVLSETSAIPGPWSNRLGPYAVGVMDAFTDPWVEQITLMASVQSMKTESAYNMLGFAISQDPAPVLVVMPTNKALKKVNRRLRNMLLASEDLSAHLTNDPDDLKYESFHLDRMAIYFATAGSEADLQFVEARIILLDEVDLYPPGAVKMAIDRSTTYWNRKIIKLSRPTLPEGHINQEYERSDQRKFWIPCPRCGGFQVLSFWQVKHKGEKRGEWPRDKRGPEYIKGQRVARYECLYCQAEIDDQDKPAMLARGLWVPEGHPFEPATGKMPPPPPVSHMGFWWNVLYSPFKNFSEVAAEFFDTKADPEKYRIFITQWLAEPWKQIVQEKEASAILELRTNRPPLIVPEGTLGLTAGIDTQRRGFWISIWAWVRGESGILDQHLVRYGWLRDEEELGLWLFQDIYWDEAARIAYPVWRGGIDIGGGAGEEGTASLTEQVYEWLRRAGQGRIFGVKGAAQPLAGGKKMSLSIIDKMPGRGKSIAGGIRVWILDTNRLKDAFWSRMAMGRVHLHAETGEDFAGHLAAEAKERDRRGREIWVQQGRRPNHLLDTAIYATAMADPECWGGVLVLPQPGAKGQEQDQKPGTWLGDRARGWLGR